LAAALGDDPNFATTTATNIATKVSKTGDTMTGDLVTTRVRTSQPFFVNSQTVTENYTIAVGDSAMAAGPVTIDSGATVTISSGSRWVIV
jgi:hypothetical protein